MVGRNIMWALFLTTAWCVSGRVFVVSPPELAAEMKGEDREAGEVKASLGNFGNPPYGSTIIGRVFYNETEGAACSPITPLDFGADPDARNSAILLVDRGSCLFVVKVRNAQDAGAQAVIIVDNVPEDVEGLIMTDNGSSGNLSIPSFLISKKDGTAIKSYLKNPETREHVVLQLRFELVQSPSLVNMVLWMSAADKNVQIFLRDFSSFADEFTNDELSFSPHYSTITCWHCAVNGYNSTVPDCLSGGRYCALDPDGPGPLSGRDVLMEDLRQICIFKEAGKQKTYSMWFDYMSKYETTCSDFSENCAVNVMQKVGIITSIITSCVENSFTGSDQYIDDNRLFSEERILSYQFPLIFTPAIFLNSVLYRGDIEASEVTLALCSSYKVPPSPCAITDPIEVPSSSTHIPLWKLLVLIVFLGVIIVGVLAAYRIWLRRDMEYEMRAQVTKAVSQYHALSSDGSQMAERPKVKTVVRKVELGTNRV